MEETNKEITPNPDIREDIKGLRNNLAQFFADLLDISEGTDREGTVAGIKRDISFKGHTAWILIFSILIASVGLNANSTAVVIGAMLISPLMGPILGIGLSIGINDIETFKRSALNFGVMVGLSILTAFLFFYFFPLKAESSELLARTKPDIRDVLIAFFGGLTGILAGSRKEKSNAIPGVAIATALMPPLCTAGYGLAIGNLEYFFGALYLFSINSIFIAFATFIVVKMLGFTMVKYANIKQRRRITWTVTILAFLVVIPSILSFWHIFQIEMKSTSANTFIRKEITYNGSELIKSNVDLEKQTLHTYFIGDLIPEGVVMGWQEKLHATDRLKDFTLVVHQGKDNSMEIAGKLSDKVKSGILEDLYVKNEERLNSKDQQIAILENELTRHRLQSIQFKEISKEIKLNYSQLKKVGYSNYLSTNFIQIDTVPILTVFWDNTLSEEEQKEQEEKLKEWMKYKLDTDTLRIISLQE